MSAVLIAFTKYKILQSDSFINQVVISCDCRKKNYADCGMNIEMLQHY